MSDATVNWAALERLLEAALRERASHAAILGLRPVDLDALRHVVARPGTTPSTLARVLQMSSGGTSAVVDRLEASGLMERTRHARGRGRIALEPTEHGRAALRDRRDELVADVSRLSGGPSAEALREYVIGLADAYERQAERIAEDAQRRRVPEFNAGHAVSWG